ncbi:hypothetical protein N0V90_011524 [Kalmusia sp. IMI 367209]|nr:hypothetical protein N0V90_011524 [Kalmusia sp. IMI 367209]
MSTSAAFPLANGNSVVPAEDQSERDFLTKLLKIRDEVYAGKHPRIRLPPKVLEQVAPRPPQTASLARPTTNGAPNGASASHLFPPRSANPLQQIPSPNKFAPPVAHTSRPFSAMSASSGIDPVLLTKSDHLIRAELQLKRQQLERGLKDQLDKRGRANDEERELLDVDALLAQAHRLVKPVSGLQPAATNSDGGESFDENSYYSSKADSWSSDEVDRNHNTNADAIGSLTQQGKRSTNEAQQAAVKPSQPGPIGAEVIDLDEEPYEPADDIEIYEPEATGMHEDVEESDYSPPPADAGPSELRRANGRYTNSGLNGSSRRQSPNGPVPPIQNVRKRKREANKEEKRRQQANKRAVRSPEPYIKEEPQSPPPFVPYSDPPSSKRRALQPLPNDVEIVSAREDNRMPVYYREPESAARLPRLYDEPMSPSVARIPQRRAERDDQDLRRVASLQHARRPYSPTNSDLYTAPSPRHSRAASHAFAERPIEVPLYREASARPSAAPRYVPDQPQEIEYLARAQSPMAMAPPPRRIVVDQYGNKYYAAPVDARDSVAPPNRRAEIDPYYERAVTREPTLRAPARAELYENDDIHMMPPPPRRYIEASEADVIDTRSYRREVSLRPTEVEYRPHEVIERRPIVQYEEMGPPREYLPSRAYSVRPEVVRREVPEGYSRHESVQPGHVRVAAPRLREVSVAHHDPHDDRRYALATSQRRYLDDGGLERPVEVIPERYATEAPRRTSYRY